MMIIEGMKLYGFKKFSDKKEINFDSRVNVIKGPNEAGKSTLLEAFIASIFGMGKSKRERSYSWLNPDVCRLALTYSLENGERYRVERDFINNSAVIFHEEEDAFVRMSEIKTRIKEILAGHFGLDSPTLFENTIVVRQNQLDMLEGKKTKTKIRDSITSILVGPTKQTISGAISSLKDERKSLKPYKGKTWKGEKSRIYKTENQLGEKEGELRKVKKDWEKLKKDQEKYEANSQELRKLEKEMSSKGNIHERYREKENIQGKLKQIKENRGMLEKTRPKRQAPLLYLGIMAVILSIILTLISPLAVVGIIAGILMVLVYYQIGPRLLPDYQEKMNELIKEKATLRTQLENYKDIKLTGADATKMQQKLDELKEKVPKLQEEVSELKGSIETKEEDLQNPVEVEEDLEEITRVRERIKTKIKALDLAVKHLESAEKEVHKDISPALSSFVGDSMKKITNNRYKKAEITPGLDIKIKIPETGKMKSIQEVDLSRGTEDQIYLTLRMAISDILSENRKLPMFFDEALINFSPERFSEAMRLLRELSEENQIMILTLHDFYDDYAGKIIELE